MRLLSHFVTLYAPRLDALTGEVLDQVTKCPHNPCVGISNLDLEVILHGEQKVHRGQRVQFVHSQILHKGVIRSKPVEWERDVIR